MEATAAATAEGIASQNLIPRVYQYPTTPRFPKVYQSLFLTMVAVVPALVEIPVRLIVLQVPAVLRQVHPAVHPAVHLVVHLVVHPAVHPAVPAAPRGTVTTEVPEAVTLPNVSI